MAFCGDCTPTARPEGGDPFKMQQVVHCEMRRLRGSAGASDAIWMLQPVKFDSPVCSGGAVSRFGPQALYVKDIMQQAYGKAYSHLRQFDGRAVF